MDAAKGHDHHGHSHGHVSVREQSRSAMLIVLGMTSTLMIVEVCVGFYTHSLALLADAGHMLSDVAALVLALVAYWFSQKPATPDKTFGYYRSEILASFFNALLLVGISAYILYESYQRLKQPPEIIAGPVLAVAVVGLVINIVSLRLLQHGAKQSLNAKAAYLEVLGDSFATAGVIISSVLILTMKWTLADPIVSGLIGIAILPRTWMLLRECINILMEGTPGHIDLDALRQALMAVEGVVDVHHIHVWTITSGLDAMSGHVTIDNRAPSDTVLTEVTRILNDDFELHHTTIQVEQIQCKEGKNSCANG